MVLQEPLAKPIDPSVTTPMPDSGFAID